MPPTASWRTTSTAGRFRADFYYRIAAYSVQLPPLRDRPGDLIPLFRSFVSEAQGQAEPAEVTPEVEIALRRRDYPGNLRDLRQLAHRVASRHVGPGPVTPGDLPPSDRPLSADGTADSRVPTLMDVDPAAAAAGHDAAGNCATTSPTWR